VALKLAARVRSTSQSKAALVLASDGPQSQTLATVVGRRSERDQACVDQRHGADQRGTGAEHVAGIDQSRR